MRSPRGDSSPGTWPSPSANGKRVRPDRLRDRHRRLQPARPRRPAAAVESCPRIPEAQRFSRIYRGRKELIDHIFVSHALVGKIAQDHVITDAAGPTPSIDDDPTKRRGAPGSFRGFRRVLFPIPFPNQQRPRYDALRISIQSCGTTPVVTRALYPPAWSRVHTAAVPVAR